MGVTMDLTTVGLSRIPFPLLVCAVVVVFYMLHILSLWPLPLEPRTLVEATTTLWFFGEVAFYLYFRHHLRNMQWLTTAPKVPREQREHIIREMLGALSKDTLGDAGYFEAFMRGWFFNAPLESIHRGNVLQFLTWAIMYKFPAQLTPAEVQEIEGYISRLEALAKHTFPPGINPSVRTIRLSLDPLRAMHRLGTVYCIVGVANSVARLVLQSRGFQRKLLGGFAYWYRPAAPGSPLKYPVVFTHGLGHGLVHYLRFLAPLTDRPLFLLELPHVSTRVWERIPTPQATVEAVHVILTEHNFSRAIFMGHSYGTINVAWAIKLRPEMVQAALLIDPISMLLCLPKVAYSFVYRKPDCKTSWLRYLLFSRELGISRTMSRAFWWQTNSLFLSDIPCFCSREAKVPCTRGKCSVRRLHQQRQEQRQKQEREREKEREQRDLEWEQVHADAEATAEQPNGDVHTTTFHPVDFFSERNLATLPCFKGVVPPTAEEAAARDASSSQGKPSMALRSRFAAPKTTKASRARDSLVDDEELPNEVALPPPTPRPEPFDCARLKIGVALSGHDTLVPSDEILQHMRLNTDFLRGSARVLYFENHNHAQFLMDSNAGSQILKLIPWLEKEP